MHEINIEISKFLHGKGIWKLNCELLKNVEYIDLINDTIQKTHQEFIVPVYSFDYIEMTNDTDLTFTIDVDLFPELLLYRIRAKTIKFASSLKKSTNIREQNLIKRISELETKENEAEISNTLEKLKTELLTIREKKA